MVEAIDEVKETVPLEPKTESLDASLCLLATQMVSQAELKQRKELEEMEVRQVKVEKLHEILQAVNETTDGDDALNWTEKPELLKLLEEARGLGVKVEEGKATFNRDERHRLVENIRLTADDLNVQNQRQYQRVTKLSRERNEGYQVASGLLSRLDQIKMAINRMRQR